MKEVTRFIEEYFKLMYSTGKLYIGGVTGDVLWNTYLGGFTKEQDPVFNSPESTTHNCNHCNNFVRRYGNIVAINDDGKLMTLYDVALLKDFPEEYKTSFLHMRTMLNAKKIKNVFFETINSLNSLPYESVKRGQQVYRLGIEHNHKRYTPAEAAIYGNVKANSTFTFNHMYLDLPKEYVLDTPYSIEKIQSEFRSSKEVFLRGMTEIPYSVLELVKELIEQGSILNGDAHRLKIINIMPLKNDFDALSADKKDIWAWWASYKLPIATFRNDVIGTLCVDLAKGKDLTEACLSWNKKVDPINYKKATAPISQRQIEAAEKFLQEKDYASSFERRFAMVEDINLDEVLHLNEGKEGPKTISVLGAVKPTGNKTAFKISDNIEEVGIEDFMTNILPKSKSVEVLLENRLEDNLVSLTTTIDKGVKPIFSWTNSYGWTYSNNLTGKSEVIKKAINKRGGNTKGVLNIRMAFPDTIVDYDLIVQEPGRTNINYTNVREVHPSSGVLDLDAQGVDGHFPPEERVENIIYTDLNRMPIGDYRVCLRDCSNSRVNEDCYFEVEFKGVTQSFKIEGRTVKSNECTVLIINFDGSSINITPGRFTKTTSTNTQVKEVYGLTTGEFQQVNLMCLSPNHWGENVVGNKHYFFMLDGCRATEKTRSFHVEYLKSDLLEHRKVLEVYASTKMLEPITEVDNKTTPQLSGLGFNATVRDSVIVKVIGKKSKVMKIIF